MEAKTVTIGKYPIGGGNPIRIQSMCNTPTADVPATVKQILALEAAGCEIVRVSVPDQPSAQAISAIKQQIHIPLVADIHFDYRLAIAAMEHGADKVRLNPGNIGAKDRVRAVAQAAERYGVPIRIGVNSGSAEKDLLEQHGGPTAQALVDSALRHASLLEDCGFSDIVLSVKASDVRTTIDACRILRKQTPYPLHLGVTEAGTFLSGTVKSAVGIGTLLADGIGDTIRVSLTDDPVQEIKVAKEILKALSLREFGAKLISCPTCARTHIDMIPLAKKVEEYLQTVDKPITVAVMGCAVNGPGEAREADIGIAGGDGYGLLFEKGTPVKKVPEAELFTALVQEIEKL